MSTSQAGSESGGAPAKPPNYLVPAILTIFCCWPLAIAAILQANQVDSKFAAGDVDGAKKASDSARMWSLISLGVGIMFFFAWMFLFLIIAIVG